MLQFTSKKSRVGIRVPRIDFKNPSSGIRVPRVDLKSVEGGTPVHPTALENQLGHSSASSGVCKPNGAFKLESILHRMLAVWGKARLECMHITVPSVVVVESGQ